MGFSGVCADGEGHIPPTRHRSAPTDVAWLHRRRLASARPASTSRRTGHLISPDGKLISEMG